MLIGCKHRKRLRTAQLGTALLAAGVLFSFGLLVYAQGENTAVEKVPAAQPEKTPLILNISKDARDTRVALDYSARWDFSDLSGLKPGIKMLCSIFKSASSWDITENTRVKYYGFRTNPWHVFLAKERSTGTGLSGTAPGNDGGAHGGNKKHLRFSLSPLVDTVKMGFDENFRDVLLSASLKRVSPELSKLSASDKKIFVRNVLSIFD